MINNNIIIYNIGNIYNKLFQTVNRIFLQTLFVGLIILIMGYNLFFATVCQLKFECNDNKYKNIIDV